MAAGEITIALTAKTGSFDTDIQRSTKAAEKRFRELEKTATQVGTAIGASLLAAGTAAIYFGKQIVDGLDALLALRLRTSARLRTWLCARALLWRMSRRFWCASTKFWAKQTARMGHLKR